MSKRHNQPARTSITHSPVYEEHGPLQVRVGDVTADGATLQMGIDYSKAEIPERAYFADYCNVVRGRGSYGLEFGKLIAGTNKLRTKVEIAFPTQMFHRQLWRGTRAFQDRMQRLGVLLNIDPIENVGETEKVQTFRANNVFMGMWGEEAVCDFYYISPKDIHYLTQNQRQRVKLEPVVRVVMSTALLNEFLNKVAPFASEDAELDAGYIEVEEVTK